MDGPAFNDRDRPGGDPYTRYHSDPYGTQSYPRQQDSSQSAQGGAPGGYGPPYGGEQPQQRYGADRYTYVRSGGAPPVDAEVIPDQPPERLSLRERARQTRRNMPWWQELPLLLIVVFCVAVLVRTFLVQAFFIPSSSMENTLQVGDRVVVDKVVYDFRQPRRGDIVVFRGTDSWAPEYMPDTNVGFFSKMGQALSDLVGISQPGEKDFVKRVVGLPGDVVACCDVNGNVTVNGAPLIEPYVTENSPVDTDPSRGRCGSRRFEPVTVGPGQMFVMGDHRLVSLDSRCQGLVPIDNVIGEARLIIWPVSHITWLSRPATFNNIPKPYAAGATRAVPTVAGIRAATSGATVPADTTGITVVLPLVLLFGKTGRPTGSRRRRRRRLRA